MGIVAVAGNVPLSHTARNALKICELAGRRDIPVFAGAEQPMGRKLVTAEHVHGKTGLDGPDLPEPTMALQQKPGVDYIIETLRAAAPKEVTLVTLGPLTDIGLALRRAPDVAGKIREIVMMAGAYFEVGNITPAAEFNVYVDPHAADLVLRSGVPVTIIPLDVPHKALTTAPRIQRFRALGTRCGRAVAEMLEFFERYDVEKYGADGAPLMAPEYMNAKLRVKCGRCRKVNVAIEVEGVDYRKAFGRGAVFGQNAVGGDRR